MGEKEGQKNSKGEGDKGEDLWHIHREQSLWLNCPRLMGVDTCVTPQKTFHPPEKVQCEPQSTDFPSRQESKEAGWHCGHVGCELKRRGGKNSRKYDLKSDSNMTYIAQKYKKSYKRNYDWLGGDVCIGGETHEENEKQMIKLIKQAHATSQS